MLKVKKAVVKVDMEKEEVNVTDFSKETKLTKTEKEEWNQEAWASLTMEKEEEVTVMVKKWEAKANLTKAGEKIETVTVKKWEAKANLTKVTEEEKTTRAKEALLNLVLTTEENGEKEEVTNLTENSVLEWKTEPN